MTLARNILIVALLAAAVAFVPGGGDTAAVVGGILSTLILVSFVLLAVRFYRERVIDIYSLGDRWRLALYGAIGVIVMAMAANDRLGDTVAGRLAWVGLLAGGAYTLYLVWRRHREYG